MTLKVTILGSGTCVPRLERSSCAVLVETERNTILLDLGPGTMRRMLEYGRTIFELTHIFLSHYHPDHSAELVPLLFSTKYPDRQKRTFPLTLVGGDGLENFYKKLQSAYGEWIVLPEGKFALHEMNPHPKQTLDFEDFSITVTPVSHRPESLSVRITGPNGHSMVYSGDTDISANLVDLARGTDLFICESALPDELKAAGHLTPGLAARMAHEAGVRHLVLTHLYPECDEVDIVKQARNAYKGKITIAEDLTSFNLG